MAARADSAFGRVDVLVNAAGMTDRGTIFDTSPELFDRMFAVNVRAPFFLMQDAAKIMRRERIEGAMVNILSMSAHGGQPFISAYCGSKGALATLTKNAAFSLMPWRIRVNGLNIGWMNTPGEDRIMRTYHDAQDGWLEKAAAQQPFGRLLDPSEVARAVAFLASRESGLMTGSIIDFDQSVVGCYESAPHPSAPALASPESPREASWSRRSSEPLEAPRDGRSATLGMRLEDHFSAAARRESREPARRGPPGSRRARGARG